MTPRLHNLAAIFLLGGCAAPPQAGPTLPPPSPAAAWELPAIGSAAPIRAAEYAARREALARGMGDGVLLVLGAAELEHDYLPFAQTPSIRYLTGITEAGAALVMEKRGGAVRSRLFVLPRDPAREVWEGPRLGAAGAERLTGIPAAPRANLLPVIDSLLATQRTLYTLAPDPGGSPVLTAEQQVIARLSSRNPGITVAPLGDALLRIRAAKSPAELDLIRRAIQITTLAHRASMRAVEPGMYEFEIQALIEYTFRRYGSERPAFASIVGSGPNSTTLHYRAADRFMQAGETVVMDIGASYRGYAADVTRTVPVSGTFSPDQREIYTIVLAAQKAAEERARPGATLADLTTTAFASVAEGLARLGLIDGAEATYDCVTGSCPQFRLFFMHGLGHGIGLDVHDPDLAYYGPFGVGSAFTIEPGIYVRGDVFDYLPDTPRNREMAARLRPVAERYRNIGVRIEDDYFITESGVERISSGAPREIAEIEALMTQPSPLSGERLPEVVEWYRGTTAP
jgi:Xaa-Pro aminopeptidase